MVHFLGRFRMAILLTLLVYLLLATWSIADPGIEYDEVLFGNASLGIQDHSFIAWTWSMGGKNVPVMLMPYIGALKAYLYVPILKLFGASPLALRLPPILLGAAALMLYWTIARRFLGSRAAMLFALLLATDPSYLYHVRLDWGPVAIMLLLKGLGAYLFLRWWHKGSLVSLTLSGFCLGLGIFDKVNFVWFPLAAAAAILVVYGRQLKARATLPAALLFVLSGALGALPVLLYNVAFPLATIREPFEASGGLLAANSPRKLQAILDTFLGTAVFKFVNGGDVQQLWGGYVPFSSTDGIGGLPALLVSAFTETPFGQGSLLALALVAAPIYLIAKIIFRPSPLVRGTIVALLTSFLILMELLITNKATGSYHVMVLYPLPQFLVAMAAVDLLGGSGIGGATARFRFPRQALVYLSIAAIVTSNLLVDVGYLRYFSTEGGKGIWSSAIYDLAEYAEARPQNRLVLMDWGFNTQLLTLSRGSIRKDEVYQWLTYGDSERLRFDAYLQDPDSLYLFHSPQYTKFAKPKEVFQRILGDKGLKEEVVKTFYQKNGEPVYYLARVIPAGR